MTAGADVLSQDERRTADLVRALAEDLPTGHGPDLDRVVERGRRERGRRRTALAVAGVVLLLLGAVGLQSRAGSPDAAPDDGGVLVRVAEPERAKEAFEDGVDAALADVGVVAVRPVWWSNRGGFTVFGPAPESGGGTARAAPGLPDGGLRVDGVDAKVATVDGEGIEVQTYRAEGAVPSGVDWCGWYRLADATSRCSLETVDDGVLVVTEATSTRGPEAVFLGEGRVVVVTGVTRGGPRSMIGVELVPADVGLLRTLAEDPRLRW